MDDEGSLFITVARTADLLGIGETLAYELVAQGEIPSVRLGRRIAVPRAWLSELAGRAAETAMSKRVAHEPTTAAGAPIKAGPPDAVPAQRRPVGGVRRPGAQAERGALAPPRLRPIG